MDGTFIAIVFVVLDDLCQTLLAPAKYPPKMTPVELMLVAVAAARFI